MNSDFDTLLSDSFEFNDEDESFDEETTGEHDSGFGEEMQMQTDCADVTEFYPCTDHKNSESSDSKQFKSILSYKDKKPCLYEFQKSTIFQIFEETLMKKAQEITAVLALTKEQAFFLLLHFKWNSEKLVEKCTDNNKLLEELGYFGTENSYNCKGKMISQRPFDKEKPDDEWICEICYDEETRIAFGLACEHFFCTNCYQRYLKDELIKGELIECMSAGCTRIFRFDDFDTLFHESPEELRMLMIKNVFKIDLSTIHKDENDRNIPEIRPIKVRFKSYHPVELGKFISERYGSDNDLQMYDDDLKNDDDDVKHDITELTSKFGSIGLTDEYRKLIEVDNDYFEDYGDQEDYIRYIDELDNIKYYSRRYEYIKNIVKKYVNTHQNYHWCPAPDCNSVVITLEKLPKKGDYHISCLPIATCVQNHMFCYNCNFEKHYPVPCTLVEKWVERCNNEAESLNWIQVNTKQCPKCDQPIEKNGGCNHMNCMKCSYQFCWICLKNWDLHINNNKCNFYTPDNDEGKSEGIDIMRQNLDKYIYYFQRFQTHQISAKQDFKLSDSISSLIKKLQRTQGISWIDCQFLKSCIVSLLNARLTLQWSYVFCFFLKDNNKKNTNSNLFLIFQQNQERLSLAVEELSKLFEIDQPKVILKRKTDFIAKARYCTSVQMNLIASIESGLVNKTFTVLE